MENDRDGNERLAGQLSDLADAHAARLAAESRVAELVGRLRTEGVSFEAIAPAIGMNAATAWETYRGAGNRSQLEYQL